MLFNKIFKNKSKINKEEKINIDFDKVQDTNIGKLEESVSIMANSNNYNEFQLDNFLENFFKIDKYFILEVSRVSGTNKQYIEIIDDTLSAIIFTSRKKANMYLNNEIEPIKSGKYGNIIIIQRSPKDIFDYIIELKENNVERILFNYPSEWISFNIK